MLSLVRKSVLSKSEASVLMRLCKFCTRQPHDSGGKWLLQFDGGSRGNPGLGGSGAVIYREDDNGVQKEVWSGYFFLGKDGVTNNVAEYHGLIEGLKQGVRMKIPALHVEGDSQLVLRQIQGQYKVNKPHLKSARDVAQELLKQIPSISFAHIPRELNKRADELSNLAMDHKTTKFYKNEPFEEESIDDLPRYEILVRATNDRASSEDDASGTTIPLTEVIEEIEHQQKQKKERRKAKKEKTERLLAPKGTFNEFVHHTVHIIPLVRDDHNKTLKEGSILLVERRDRLTGDMVIQWLTCHLRIPVNADVSGPFIKLKRHPNKRLVAKYLALESTFPPPSAPASSSVGGDDESVNVPSEPGRTAPLEDPSAGDASDAEVMEHEKESTAEDALSTIERFIASVLKRNKLAGEIVELTSVWGPRVVVPALSTVAEKAQRTKSSDGESEHIVPDLQLAADINTHPGETMCHVELRRGKKQIMDINKRILDREEVELQPQDKEKGGEGDCEEGSEESVQYPDPALDDMRTSFLQLADQPDVVKVYTIPVPSLLQYLKRETTLGKKIDERLTAWAFSACSPHLQEKSHISTDDFRMLRQQSSGLK